MTRKTQGFTLLELLAVMAIVAVLVALGTQGYRHARLQARESQAVAELERLRLALDEFRAEYGRYPEQLSPAGIATLPGIGFLTNAVEGVVLVDPWGRDYQYQCSNRFLYSIWSKGQDAGSDEDDIRP